MEGRGAGVCVCGGGGGWGGGGGVCVCVCVCVCVGLRGEVTRLVEKRLTSFIYFIVDSKTFLLSVK